MVLPEVDLLLQVLGEGLSLTPQSRQVLAARSMLVHDCNAADGVQFHDCYDEYKCYAAWLAWRC